MKTDILLSDITSGERFASAPDEAVISTSNNLWKGFRLEHHILAPAELAEHHVVGHRLMIAIGDPVFFENRIGNTWTKQVYHYGDFKLLADKAPNAPRWHNPLHMLALAIEPDFASALTEQENIHFNVAGKRNDPVITRLAEMLFTEMKQGNMAGSVFGESLVVGLVMHLVAHYQDNKSAFRLVKGKLSSVELKRVLAYLHDNLADNPSLYEMAELVNLSAFHFSRLFRNTVGLAPHQFVLRIKLEQAQRLIRQPHNSLTAIATELGFADQAHFSKAFKKATGFSPREYQHL